jgi:putative phage-type endonuclease
MSIEWDIPEPVVTVKRRIIFDVEQGSDEWLLLRAGLITGSKISDVMAKGAGIVRNKYLTKLSIERITKTPIQMDFKSAAMIKGNADEPLAREHYEFINDVDAVQVAFVHHQTIENCGASPDSLIGDDGLLEIKCPNIETHVGYLLTKKIPGNYMSQMQWQMACTGREWCDWMTYCKDMPIHIRSMIIRVFRDEQRISEMEIAVKIFNDEVDELTLKLGQMK